MSGSRLPGVSIVGVGKGKDGFEPLPSSEPPVLVAARKSRQHKNCVVLKIGAVILFISAAVAGLAAFLLTRGSNQVLQVPVPGVAESRVMKDQLTAMQEVKKVAEANTVFGIRLYNLLREQEGNMIMSPFSVSGVMAMVSSGARGETLAQITQGMSFPASEQLTLGYRDVIPALRTNQNFTLEAANSIFCQDGFDLLPAFKETMHQHFHASIQGTNFAESSHAARLINDWVEAATRNKIKDLIKSDMLDASTRLVLVNAIYFKGDWASKFDPKLTTEQDFHLSDGTTKKVAMMRQKQDLPIAELEGLEATMIELPYKGDSIVMQVLLPKAMQGLSQLEDRLRTMEDLEQLFQSNQREEKVVVKLPKFKLEQTIPLTSYLQELGMREMFDNGKADFSGMDGSKLLYVSSVVQKAFIEVNEEGSEAAAATGAVMMMRSMPMPPMTFTADHPFVFFLKDKLTGMLLFQGRVQDPVV